MTFLRDFSTEFCILATIIWVESSCRLPGSSLSMFDKLRIGRSQHNPHDILHHTTRINVMVMSHTFRDQQTKPQTACKFVTSQIQQEIHDVTVFCILSIAVVVMLKHPIMRHALEMVQAYN